jgi:hypothetical protein
MSVAKLCVEIRQIFPRLSTMMAPVKQFFHIPRNPHLCNLIYGSRDKNSALRHLAYRDCSSVANKQTKVPTIFRVVLINFYCTFRWFISICRDLSLKSVRETQKQPELHKLNHEFSSG